MGSRKFAVSLRYAFLAVALSACTAEKGAPKKQSTQTLTIGAYTTPREAYGRAILPAFASKWKSESGDSIRFETSYQGSGAQARAIAAGFEADIAALSLEPDIVTLEKAHLITSDWRAGTNGGAMWNVLAMYGSALRGLTSAARSDSAAAQKLLADVVHNVAIMDKGARDAMLTFESGVGDATITYENEVLVARAAGKQMDYVVPNGTIVIENPVAVVDVYADRHGNRKIADAFVQYLSTDSAQAAFQQYGLRRVDGETPGMSPIPPTAFTIRDLGGWDKVVPGVFGPGGVFDRA